jgi:hypothetical protein
MRQYTHAGTPTIVTSAAMAYAENNHCTHRNTDSSERNTADSATLKSLARSAVCLLRRGAGVRLQIHAGLLSPLPSTHESWMYAVRCSLTSSRFAPARSRCKLMPRLQVVRMNTAIIVLRGLMRLMLPAYDLPGWAQCRHACLGAVCCLFCMGCGGKLLPLHASIAGLSSHGHAEVEPTGCCGSLYSLVAGLQIR